MNIYVGNLAAEVTDTDLRSLFECFGKVETAKVIREKFSEESRGFGFVEMAENNDARAAIDGLNATEFKGRGMITNEAHPKKSRRR
ncbi:MAG: RNA recognition motif domain-containing protein [Planctomycetota bacterium]|jgi:RNA recognition motif-containing protein